MIDTLANKIFCVDDEDSKILLRKVLFALNLLCIYQTRERT